MSLVAFDVQADHPRLSGRDDEITSFSERKEDQRFSERKREKQMHKVTSMNRGKAKPDKQRKRKRYNLQETREKNH